MNLVSLFFLSTTVQLVVISVYPTYDTKMLFVAVNAAAIFLRLTFAVPSVLTYTLAIPFFIAAQLAFFFMFYAGQCIASAFNETFPRLAAVARIFSLFSKTFFPALSR